MSKVPEWAMDEAERVGEETYGRHERGFIKWPLVTECGLHPRVVIALALVAAEKRGIERAASKADEIAAGRSRQKMQATTAKKRSEARDFESMAMSAIDVSYAIRQLGESHE